MIGLGEKYGFRHIALIPMHCAPAPAAVIAAQNIVSGIVPTLQTLATAWFIDRAIAVATHKAAFATVWAPLAAIVAMLAYTWFAQALSNFAGVRLELALREKFRAAVTEKRARMEYRHVENAKDWDLISRVAKEPEIEFHTAYGDLWRAVLGIEQIVGVMVLLLAQVWWAALLIVAVSAPLFYLAYKGGKASYDSEREVSKYRRKYEYLSEVLTGRDAADERSLFGFGGEIGKSWFDQFEAARKIQFRTQRKWFVRCKTGSIVTTCVSLLVMLVLLGPAVAGEISIGMFISLTGAVFSLVQSMSWQLSYLVDQTARHREYLKDLTAFAALSETEGAAAKPVSPPLKVSAIEFRDVSFCYPGTQTHVLDHLSFRMEPGRHYALVGVNGAGKTTVTKLMTGLYPDFEGEILLGEREIRTYDQSELKALYSVVYQDFAKYSIPFADNILLGDTASMGREDEKRLEAAVELAGLGPAAAKLPLGMKTPLGKIREGGVDLSGGEWQRVAMARAVAGKAPVLILDEPTAALDPVSESRLYEEFEKVSRGRTTVFISHRLGSTRLADEIFVIGNGRVTEHGSHDELMRLGKEYAAMFESQRSWYE